MRQPADRPAVTIPPRKRQRITYSEDDEDPEGFQSLRDREAEDSEDDGNRQLVLHADFEDDDEEDDDDFAPGEDDDAEEDEESEEALEDENEKEEAEKGEEHPSESHPSEAETDDANEPALADIKDQAIRAKIRKLHSAFPKAPLAVCEYVLNGSEDIGEAYEAMARGFIPAKSKSAIAEISQGVNQGNLSVPKTRSKAKTPSVHESENVDSMQVEPDENQNALIDYYDRNGLPEGSIKSGKALSFMAEALKSSPARPRSEPRRSASVASNKSVRFALNGSFSNGLISTPFIDKESQVEEEEESEDDSDEESAESSIEDATSSEDSSSSSDEEEGEATSDASDGTSSSESDSENSSDSSSDDESPEETSSKQEAIASAEPNKLAPSQDTKPETVGSGQGTRQTRSRNQRRRDANVLSRLKEKGILPTGTTLTEFIHLKVDQKTSPETALAALETIRAENKSPEVNDGTGIALTQAEELQLRRQELLASIAAGGIDVDAGSSKSIQKSPAVVTAPEVQMEAAKTSVIEAVESQQVVESAQNAPLQQSVESQQNVELHPSVESQQIIESQEPVESQEVMNRFSTALDHRDPASTSIQSGATDVGMGLPSSAPAHSAADAPSTSPKAPPATVESSQPSSSRRAKLDLGAGRRLLFGALGIKTPKPKKDEEKVRGDLMKDVRPVLPPKTTVEAEPNPADEAADEDLEAWREKINYRAVECVQEGIDLSEPPFPFVQRWDPQQQGSWSQTGNRGGKRKQDQRNQAQYYHDDTRASKKQKRRKGKHNYAEQQEYLDASYEPSYQDDSMISQFDDPTQAERRRLQSDDVEGEISQQLMNDILNPTAGFSQGPDDLASLPENPSTLPNLQDGQAKVGMTIAFKKLEMSEATKWQPQVSGYQTAIVVDITESGKLQLTLAMRDRERLSKRYDQETGERIYSKFEVPDDDEMDDGQDDGRLGLSFSELIDPKIVQEPPSNLGGDAVMEEASRPKQFPSFDTIALSHEEGAMDDRAEEPAEEPADAQFSHVTETPLNSDGPDSNEPEETMRDVATEPSSNDIPAVNESVVKPYTPAAEVPDSHTVDLVNLAEPDLAENRQEIAHWMREAGWRSNVPSSVIRDLRPDGMESPGEAAELEKLRQDMIEIPSNHPYSPKFNNPGSSSPTRKPRDASKSPEKDIREESPQMLPQSSWETVDEPPSSPPKPQGESSSWITEKSQEELPVSASAPAAPELSQPKSEKKAPARKAPLGTALQLWQQFQPRKRSATPNSGAESSKTSPDPGLGLDGADDRESIASVHYPKLSVGSSFTSQVAVPDHGRQPDFDFEDSADLTADTQKEPDADGHGFSHDTRKDADPVGACLASPREVMNSKSMEDPLSDIEPDLPPKKPADKHAFAQRKIRDILEDDPDDLPTIQEIILSQRSVKRETVTPVPAKSSTKKNAEHKKAMDTLDEELYGEDQTTPKASQKQKSVSAIRSSKDRRSEKPASQPQASVARASQSRPSQSQPIPQGSQIVDLTMSSDVEPEEEDLDDDDYEDELGWKPKKNSTIRGVETRRHTSVGLRDSSDLNTRNRRKTSAM